MWTDRKVRRAMFWWHVRGIFFWSWYKPMFLCYLKVFIFFTGSLLRIRGMWRRLTWKIKYRRNLWRLRRKTPKPVLEWSKELTPEDQEILAHLINITDEIIKDGIERTTEATKRTQK